MRVVARRESSICCVCRGELDRREAIGCATATCGARYHPECWVESFERRRACAVYGCASRAVDLPWRLEPRWPAVDLLVMGILGATVFAFALSAGWAVRRQHAEDRCGANLRAIAMASIQYVDDFRFTPHFASASQLDGDHTTDVAARAMSALSRTGELPDPSVFVCPSSPDDAPDMVPAVRPLACSTDLSYGWTRRAFTSNTNGQCFLAGDKARRIEERAGEAARAGNMRGNHRDAMLVVLAGASVVRIRPTQPTWNVTTEWISRTGPQGGYLGVLGD